MLPRLSSLFSGITRDEILFLVIWLLEAKYFPNPKQPQQLGLFNLGPVDADSRPGKVENLHYSGLKLVVHVQLNLAITVPRAT